MSGRCAASAAMREADSVVASILLRQMTSKTARAAGVQPITIAREPAPDRTSRIDVELPLQIETLNASIGRGSGPTAKGAVSAHTRPFILDMIHLLRDPLISADVGDLGQALPSSNPV
jgi:hypothetical protein